jgi:hypothetical protein
MLAFIVIFLIIVSLFFTSFKKPVLVWMAVVAFLVYRFPNPLTGLLAMFSFVGVFVANSYFSGKTSAKSTIIVLAGWFIFCVYTMIKQLLF